MTNGSGSIAFSSSGSIQPNIVFHPDPTPKKQPKWYMAARHQNRFAAAIPIAARPESDSGEIEWRIPLYIIHSRQDEVVPLEPVETVVGQLKARGVSVELVVVEGITHFETSRFIGPLRAAIPWIQNVWK